MKIENGTTRKVFLIGKYAIKIPQVSYTFRLFLEGIIGNLQEAEFSCLSGTCPVLFRIGGFLVIMPRCKPLTDEEFDALDFTAFPNIPVEPKRSSFGNLNGRIVAVDYGS